MKTQKHPDHHVDPLEELRNDPKARERINAAGPAAREFIDQLRLDELDQERSALITAHQAELDALDRLVMRTNRRGTNEESAAKAASPTVSEAISAFVAEKNARGRWSPKTAKKYGLAFRLFVTFLIEHTGSEPRVNEVQREWVVEYVQLLQRLPPNIGRDYPNRPLGEIALLGLLPMSSSAINDNIGIISGVLGWCQLQSKYGLAANVASRLTIKSTPQRELRAFTDTELSALLSSPAYRDGIFLQSFQYWLIPLALFTGARLGELCQLMIADFESVDDVLCIHINETGEGKSVKNKNARRLIPLHSCLLHLGLGRYAETLRARGEVRLFPEIDLKLGASHTASKWFNDKGRYSDRCGVNDKNTNFHSFRRTFITRTLTPSTGARGAELHEVQAIVGHELVGDTTTNVYLDHKSNARGRQRTVEQFQLPSSITELIPCIEKVRFGKLPRRT